MTHKQEKKIQLGGWKHQPYRDIREKIKGRWKKEIGYLKLIRK